MSRASEVEVAIVGGGPAGLAAALWLRQHGRQVTVVEREAAAGGVPRHVPHSGFGLRDLRQMMTGPAYAAAYADRARAAGVTLLTRTTVTGWSGPTRLALTGPDGLRSLDARAVLLATGCRERPRAARLVPGSRPLGVFTTGAMQRLVHEYGQCPGRTAVIVGAEHVSFSAIPTLLHGGTRPVAMITEHPADQTWAPLRWLTASRHRVPIFTGTRVTRIAGARRVEGVEVTRRDGRTVERIACDTVVFTGDWIPDHELARRGDVDMDAGTRAPRVDGALRTSRRGVFAAGNLLHAAEAADVAALGGRHAAAMIAEFLTTDHWPVHPPVPVVCQPPLLWASPSAVDPTTPLSPRDVFVLRTSRFAQHVLLTATQGQNVLWQKRFRALIPNRSITASARWTAAVDPDGPPVVFRST